MMLVKALTNTADTQRSWEQLVQTQVNSLRFGIVQIVVHDGTVVQIERTERLRLEKPESKGATRDA